MTGPSIDIDRERNRLHNLQARIEPFIERLWEGEDVRGCGEKTRWGGWGDET